MQLTFGPIKKPRTAWFGVMSHFRPAQDVVPAAFAVFWQLAKDIDRDLAWQQWWTPAGVARLEPRPLPDPRAVRVMAVRDRNYRLVQGGGPELLEACEVLLSAPDNKWDQSWVEAHQPAADEAVAEIESISYQILAAGAEMLGLDEPPGRPAQVG